MAKRPGAAVLAGGALMALLSPGAASAQDAVAFPREVSGGYASWTSASAALSGRGVSMDVAEPAVEGAGDRSWFPATGGGADPESGGAEVELGGVARLSGSAGAERPLVLGALRLRLDGGSGALYVRTAVDGQARELALADVVLDGAEPVVRTSGVTWAGLRASLTDEGAALLASWSGEGFAAGDGLGMFDVTVGTGSGSGSGSGSGGGGSAEDAVPAESSAAGSPSVDAPKSPESQGSSAGPTAAVGHATLAPGAEQEVTGEGFEPGEVVLVAIDDDTRYQAVADAAGRVSRSFPVYATAVEGEHTAELYAVTGDRRAVVRFGVQGSSGSS